MFLCAMGALGALVFFFALMAFVADSPASLNRQHHKADRNKESAEQHQGQAEENSVNSAIIEKHQPSPDEEEACATRKKRDRLDYTTFAVTTLTLFVIFIYTLINYRLYKETVRTNQASQRAAIFETRVEMIKASPELLKEFPKDATAAISTHFKNFGPTPATDVIEMSSPCLLKGDIPSDFSYRDLRELPHPKRLVPPQEEFIDGVPFRADEVDAVTTYQASLFVWGTVTYIDVFKKRHFTAFCVKYEATGQIGNDSKSRVQEYEQCSYHNCVDENCPKDHYWGPDDSIDCLNVGPSVRYPNSQPTP